MKNKIIGLLALSFITLLLSKLLATFTNLLLETSLLTIVICNGIVIPIIFALGLYRKSISNSDSFKRIVIMGVVIWLSVALIGSNVYGLILLVL